MIFLKWFLSLFRTTPRVVKCQACGAKRPSYEMHREPGYGWFCTEDEFTDYWWRCQW